MENYRPGKQVQELLEQLQAQQEKKPGDYQSPWQGAISELLGQIQNRKPFRYDPGADPMYRQAVDRYVRLGRQAMMDTVGRAAALTGGYDNSYAQTVGQQTYQKYLLGLSAQLPQYQQMALQRYQAEGKDLMDRYAVLHQQDQSGFDRYQQAVNLYYGELNRLQNAYDRQQDRDRNAFVADRDFEYGRQQDAQEAARQAEAAKQAQIRFELQQAYQKERDKIRDQQWQQDFDEGRRRHDLEMQMRQMEAAARAAAASRRGGSSHGSGRRPSQESHSGPFNRFSRDEYYNWRQRAAPARQNYRVSR